MKVPELKSLARDRGLRNYSRMRKAQLVAFLTIWVRIIIRCAGQNRRAGAKARAFDKTCVISQFAVGNKILPILQHFTYSRKYLISNCISITLG